MTTDLQLKKQVLDRLKLKPNFDATALGVTVEAGVVTLSGSVENEAELAAAERVVRVIKGVKGVVAHEVQVKSVVRPRQDDRRLEAAARDAIQWLTTAPQEKLKVTVRDGWLTLEGEVETLHQAQCVEAVLREIPGIHGVENAARVVRRAA